MYGLSDDLADMSKGIRASRTLMRKAYLALQKDNIELAKELLKQADKAALNGLNIIGSGDKKGCNGKPIKASWQKS